MSVAGTCEQKMDALASLYVSVTYTSCKTRVGIKVGGLEPGSAPKDTTNAIISISGEESAKRLSSQSMYESPWVGHEDENYIVRVSSTPGSVSTARKTTVIMKIKLTICGRGVY